MTREQPSSDSSLFVSAGCWLPDYPPMVVASRYHGGTFGFLIPGLAWWHILIRSKKIKYRQGYIPFIYFGFSPMLGSKLLRISPPAGASHCSDGYILPSPDPLLIIQSSFRSVLRSPLIKPTHDTCYPCVQHESGNCAQGSGIGFVRSAQWKITEINSHLYQHWNIMVFSSAKILLLL